MKNKLQKKASMKLKNLRSMLNKASKGISLNGKGSDIFLDDAPELVKYYSYVARGKMKEAYKVQSEAMDTATSDLIDTDMYEAVYDEANK